MADSAGDLFDRLVSVMAQLRGPAGCPWDKQQTLATINDYMLEEAYEAYEAARRRDWDGLAEELGDLAFEIVFLARLAEEAGRFDVRRSLQSILDKLVRRHPHVFGDLQITDPDEVNENWRAIKAMERGAGRKAASELDGVPKSLPPLLQAQRLSERTRSRVTREDARMHLSSAISGLERLLAVLERDAPGMGPGDEGMQGSRDKQRNRETQRHAERQTNAEMLMNGETQGDGESQTPARRDDSKADLLGDALWQIVQVARFFGEGLSSALLARLDHVRDAAAPQNGAVRPGASRGSGG